MTAAFGSELDPTWTFPVRAQLVTREGCDKYCWSKVRILELLAGAGGFLVEGTTVSVASPNTGSKIPEGESILILKSYGNEKGLWQLAIGDSQPAIHSLSEMHGMTPSQCKRSGGRVDGDFDKGCSDKEVCLGPVKYMMCSCWCCASAIESTAPIKALREIAAPDPKLYEGIHDARDWRNPLLTFDEKGVRLEYRSVVSPSELIPKLEKLPRTAWPYGRVVVIYASRYKLEPDSKYQKKLGDIYRKRDAIVQKTKLEVIRLLEENGVQVREWAVLYPTTEKR